MRRCLAIAVAAAAALVLPAAPASAVAVTCAVVDVTCADPGNPRTCTVYAGGVCALEWAP